MEQPTSPRLTHALVLTAGLGTRLDPLTRVRAKPAVPLLGEPLVSRIVRWLVGYGVTELVLNLHALPHTVATILGDGGGLGARVRYSWEQPILGSAGGPRRAAPIVGADPFLIVNGDTLADIDLTALIAAHERSGARVTMALTPNRAPERYGGVRLDERGGVVGFARRGNDAVDSYHFVGVQVAAAAAFDAVAPGAAANSIGEIYDRLIAAHPGSVRGHVSEGEFWDIGTVLDYWRTSRAFAARTSQPDALGRGRDLHIAPDAVVRHTILWDHIRIGAGAVLDECIVTDNVIVAQGARHHREILMQSATGLESCPFDPQS